MPQSSNPFSDLVAIMRDQGSAYNPTSIQLAEVINPPPNLIIKFGDLEIDKDFILIADYLLDSYKRQITIPSTSASGTAGDHSISSISIPNGEIDFKDTLKKGDLLAVMPTQDKQKYIIIAKVVSL